MSVAMSIRNEHMNQPLPGFLRGIETPVVMSAE
jgi:hypothetical protein